MDEDDGADARLAIQFRKALPQALFDGMQKIVQHGVLQFGVVEAMDCDFRHEADIPKINLPLSQYSV
ncbi:hypothetical protein [Pseudogulbenkiania subflava]|uniref:hypothetical protein n=1 Tax=Pseudogulbenkiania subflava TaxID=451637 RepID=UPI00117AFABF|nr:hypothetical protein [Pseudogulbenkiania subflava]